MLPIRVRRAYALALIVYIALGFVFIGRSYALDGGERVGDVVTTHPVTKVPTGSDDATVERYYDYLQLRHLQQQTETFSVNGVTLTITYGVLGAIIVIFSGLGWMWYAKSGGKSQAGLYPVEVYNGYIAERGGPIEFFTWSNYVAMLAFVAFYVWWNLVFGQWY
jgi:hypothetical protein